jgi:hypothetical protein
LHLNPDVLVAIKVIHAPPWLVGLLISFLARTVVRNLQRAHPDFSPEQIVATLREEMGPDPGEPEWRMLEAVRARLPSGVSREVPEPATPSAWYSPSALALIAANLLPLWAIVVWGWPVFPLLVLFWMENVAIGLTSALRMLLADPGDIALWAAKLFMVPFFCMHYGLFTAIHGKLVFGIFGGREYARLDYGWLPVHAAARAVQEYDLWLPLAALVASHLFSLCWDYILRGGYRRAALTELMVRPYDRVFVLHLTIILGGWAVMLLGSPVWALVVLVILKIAFDLKVHLRHATK